MAGRDGRLEDRQKGRSNRLAQQAQRLREQASTLKFGVEREWLLRKARQFETAAHVRDWLKSPGLQPPK
jgi:hypothetical protein